MGDTKKSSEQKARIKRVIAVLSKRDPRLLEKWLAAGERRVGARTQRKRRL